MSTQKSKPFTFIVGIDDGDCRYEYPLTITDSTSIREIYLTLCEQYANKPVEGICCPSKAREIKKLLGIKEED